MEVWLDMLDTQDVGVKLRMRLVSPDWRDVTIFKTVCCVQCACQHQECRVLDNLLRQFFRTGDSWCYDYIKTLPWTEVRQKEWYMAVLRFTLIYDQPLVKQWFIPLLTERLRGEDILLWLDQMWYQKVLTRPYFWKLLEYEQQYWKQSKIVQNWYYTRFPRK